MRSLYYFIVGVLPSEQDIMQIMGLLRRLAAPWVTGLAGADATQATAYTVSLN